MVLTLRTSWTVKHHLSVIITREYQIDQEPIILDGDLVYSPIRSLSCYPRVMTNGVAVAAAWSLLVLASLSDGREGVEVSSPDLKQKIIKSS